MPEPGEDDDGALGTTPSALDLLTQATRAMQVDRCLDTLDGSHRQSLALAYYQGLSHTEVALQMGEPLGSVKAWIRRGLDKLKTCLEAKG
jgi:RNA polymerase sigma-70 factor (ECF subfamily)